MKRLTDERIAALIDMVPLNEMPSTIVDIKSALTELQERRNADAEPVAWLHANNSIGIPAITVSKKVANDWYQNGLNVQPLYAAPQPAPIPDEVTVEAVYPEVQTGWNDAKNYVAGWNACRAAMLNGGKS